MFLGACFSRQLALLGSLRPYLRSLLAPAIVSVSALFTTCPRLSHPVGRRRNRLRDARTRCCFWSLPGIGRTPAHSS
jgi:hypothetical protein